MQNWVDLVKHTTEYAPPPYKIMPVLSESEPEVVLMCATDHNTVEVVCGVAPTLGGGFCAGQDGPEWCDPVQEATARLFRDAPALLMMLARLVTLIQSSDPPPCVVEGEPVNVLGEARELLRRHVRIGCAPVDAESRQPKRYPDGFFAPRTPLGPVED